MKNWTLALEDEVTTQFQNIGWQTSSDRAQDSRRIKKSQLHQFKSLKTDIFLKLYHKSS
jgi:hypothetical protein